MRLARPQGTEQLFGGKDVHQGVRTGSALATLVFLSSAVFAE